ncbi:MAG TPA: hypothetical protein VNS58_27090 [Puia sp.]|nr:hypothetical protein [Puia sp.]
MQTYHVNDLLKSAFQDANHLDIKQLFENKLTEYDLSKTKALSILNIDKDVFEDIISGSAKQPSMINILKIAQFIDVDINEVVTAFLKTQSSENIAAIEKARKVTFVVKFFDVKKLTKLGFFEESESVDYWVQRILTFFDYESISEFEEELTAPLYSKGKRKFSDKMKDFWVKSAYQCFKSINNPNLYNRDNLKDLLVKVKPYCQDVENGLFTVCKALYNVGITVIVQNQLATTQVRGATFIVNGKPCIVLTDLFKKYPTLWTTLIHELHHVLYDMDLISSTQYHLTGDPDLFLIEEKADSFSMEYFCGVEHFNYIKPHINNPFIVAKFAKELDVHPSFIYSAYRYFQNHLYQKNYYGAFTEFLPSYSLAIDKLTPITWKENSLSEIAQNIKTIFEVNT